MAATRTLLILLLLFGRSLAWSQSEPALITDRPGLSYSARVVPTDYLQLETGVANAIAGLNNRGTFQQHNHVAQLRYGLLKKVEVSSDVNYGFSVVNWRENSEEYQNSFNSLRVGTRYQILSETNTLPDLTAGLFYRIPVGETAEDLKDALPEFLLTANKTVYDKISINPSFVLFLPSASSKPDVITTLNVGYSATDSWGVFVGTAYQQFGKNIENNEKGSVYLEAGTTYLLRPNMQFDLDFGTDAVNHNWNSLYFNVGFSWRIQPFSKTE